MFTYPISTRTFCYRSRLQLTTPGVGQQSSSICVNICVSTNKKGLKQLSLSPYNVLVAGTGFEPVTFGL